MVSFLPVRKGMAHGEPFHAGGDHFTEAVHDAELIGKGIDPSVFPALRSRPFLLSGRFLRLLPVFFVFLPVQRQGDSASALCVDAAVPGPFHGKDISNLVFQGIRVIFFDNPDLLHLFHFQHTPSALMFSGPFLRPCSLISCHAALRHAHRPPQCSWRKPE